MKPIASALIASLLLFSGAAASGKPLVRHDALVKLDPEGRPVPTAKME